MVPWGLLCSYHYLAEMVKAVGWVGGAVVKGPVVKTQFFQNAFKPNYINFYMDRGFWAKRWDHITQNWENAKVGPDLFLSLFSRNGKGSWVGRWWYTNFLQMVQNLICPNTIWVEGSEPKDELI